MALEYRYEFGSDVVVDLIGFRRHGHSEVDDPTITQPILYRKIKDRPLLYLSYAQRVGIDPHPFVEKFQSELDVAQKAGKSMAKKPVMRQLPSYWAPFHGGPYNPADEVDTGLPASELLRITDGLTTYPADFHIHPKVQKLLEQRREMGSGKRPLDYGMAEALAFGSLALQGTPIRLSGQDSRRGTFNQRHSVLIDIIDEKEYVPLCHLAPGQARVEIYNSELSEAAVMGFEYGFSRDFPEALVMWEAQFGDFANGAQIIIDQFIVAGEDKWDLLTGLVLLLPHGHEGQGPEHSSARIERYLQLCARDNMQVAQPSTAAQYFHLLRRQAMRKWRTPLIVFTPKSMLRHPEAFRRSLTWSVRASVPYCPTSPHSTPSACCSALGRSATSFASSAATSSVRARRLLCSNRCIPSPKTNSSKPSAAIPMRRSSSGYRKSLPTWERCRSLCRACDELSGRNCGPSNARPTPHQPPVRPKPTSSSRRP